MKRHWPVGAEVVEAAFEGGRMLYDTQRTSNFSPEFFDPQYWRKHDAIEGTARGRGTTWFIRTGDSSFVLRHYRRGGLMAKISTDKYWWHDFLRDWDATYSARIGRSEGLRFVAEPVVTSLLFMVNVE